MPKWEHRLVEIIDKKLPVLACFLIILFSVYMRRLGHYYNSFDFDSHFYPEFPGYLYTPFYTLFIRKLPAISITPAVQVKILVCLFDFVAAAGAVMLLKQEKALRERSAMLACFTLFVVSPLTIEYGLLWLRFDSVCMAAFLWALTLHRRRHSVPAGILFGAGIALLTPYVVLLPLLLLCEWRNSQTQRLNGALDNPGKCLPLRALFFSGTAVITALFLNLIAIGALGIVPLREGLFMLIDWLIVDPESGVAFSGLSQWAKVMPSYFGYMAGMLALITAFGKPKYRVRAAVIHLLLLLYAGYILQNGW